MGSAKVLLVEVGTVQPTNGYYTLVEAISGKRWWWRREGMLGGSTEKVKGREKEKKEGRKGKEKKMKFQVEFFEYIARQKFRKFFRF